MSSITVNLNENMHAKYKVAIFNIANVITNVKVMGHTHTMTHTYNDR